MRSLVELLAKDMGSAQKDEEYIQTAVSMLAQAVEELEKGDLGQASEKIWEAWPPQPYSFHKEFYLSERVFDVFSRRTPLQKFSQFL